MSPAQAETEDLSIARSMLDGQGFSFQQLNYFGPTSIRPPVYPLALFGLLTVFGSGSTGLIAAKVLNLVAAGVGVLAAHQVGKNLFQKGFAPTLFAMLLAIWPAQIVAATYFQGLTLAVCFLLIFIALITSDSPSRAPLAGLFAGLAVLTESILLVPITAVYIWICAAKPSRAMIALAASLCIVLPWIYRNVIVHEQFTGITNTLWTDIYLGNGQDATGSRHLKSRDFSGKPLTRFDLTGPIELDQLKKQTEARRSEILQKWSSDWIAEHPAEYLRLGLIRMMHSFWMDWNHPKAWNVLNVVPRSIALIGLLIASFHLLTLCRQTSQTIEDIPAIDPLESVRQLRSKPKEIRERLALNPIVLSVVLMIAIALSTALTMSEARNSIFVDIAQLLAVATLADKKRDA